MHLTNNNFTKKKWIYWYIINIKREEKNSNVLKKYVFGINSVRILENVDKSREKVIFTENFKKCILL